MTKNEQVKQTLKLTKERRKTQTCKTYELKLDKSHLSKEKLNFLNKLFLEAKWLYNFQLSQEDIFNIDYKLKEVEILNKNKQKEKREIKYLSSKIKQTLINRTRQNIVNLSKSKKKNNKVGKLKFKSYVNSIPLDQYNNTHYIKNINYIKIAGFKKYFKVLGIKQIPKEAEFANANLIKSIKDYYLKIICFLPKETKLQTNNSIGLDFGIKDNVVDSNENKYNFQFPETKQLKKISRKLNKCKKGSNRYKLKLTLQKEYKKITNKKKDTKNKFVSKLVKENDNIFIQDESIHQWHKSKFKGFGRKIQYSIMGGIIFDLKRKSETSVINRYFASTKTCRICNYRNDISLGDRIFTCINCNHIEDRDIHSARNILNEGLKQISMEHRNSMPLERDTKSFNVSFNEGGSQEVFNSW